MTQPCLSMFSEFSQIALFSFVKHGTNTLHFIRPNYQKRVILTGLTTSERCHIYVSCVCFRIRVSNTYYVVCLRLVYPMVRVSFQCPFLIAPSVFLNVYSSSNSLQKSREIGHLFSSLRYITTPSRKMRSDGRNN